MGLLGIVPNPEGSQGKLGRCIMEDLEPDSKYRISKNSQPSEGDNKIPMKEAKDSVNSIKFMLIITFSYVIYLS